MWFEPRRHIGCVAAVALATFVQELALDERAVALFLRELQRGVTRGDRAAVAALIRYPLTVFAGGVRIPIADQAALLQNYQVVFPPALETLIGQAAISARGRPSSNAAVTITGDFASIGAEAVRIERIGGALKVTRITVPLATPATATGAAAGGAGRAPERLMAGVGQVQRAGALAAGERDAYLLKAAKNQLLEVRINGVSRRDIVARITNVKSRAAIDSRAQDGARTWIGRIPDDGDYRIDVVRLAAAGPPRLEYLMIVALR
jgi:hypothetical protein